MLSDKGIYLEGMAELVLTSKLELYVQEKGNLRQGWKKVVKS